MLGGMQTFVLLLIVYQYFQKRRVRDNGEGEEDIGVVETLREIPVFKQIITVMEGCVRVFYDSTSTIVPDGVGEGWNDVREAFSDIKEEVEAAFDSLDTGRGIGDVLEKAKCYAEDIIAKVKGNAMDFANSKVDTVKGTFEEARAAKWRALEDEGVEDVFFIAGESTNAGLDALVGLAKGVKTVRKTDIGSLIKDAADSAGTAVKDSMEEVLAEAKEAFMENVSEEKERIRDAMVE